MTLSAWQLKIILIKCWRLKRAKSIIAKNIERVSKAISTPTNKLTHKATIRMSSQRGPFMWRQKLDASSKWKTLTRTPSSKSSQSKSNNTPSRLEQCRLAHRINSWMRALKIKQQQPQTSLLSRLVQENSLTQLYQLGTFKRCETRCRPHQRLLPSTSLKNLTFNDSFSLFHSSFLYSVSFLLSHGSIFTY